MEIKVYQYWDPILADDYVVNIQSEFNMNSNCSPNGVNMGIDPIDPSIDVQLIWSGNADDLDKCHLPLGVIENIKIRIDQIISEEGL